MLVRRIFQLSRAAILLAAATFAVAPRASAGAPDLARPTRPVATYSIVAFDPATGEFGVAVQSHWFSVGAIVPWAEAGVGAVATQSFVEPSYGPLGLALLKSGRSAKETLDGLLAADSNRDVRQVAIVDKLGNVANWTGPKCIAAAGGTTGPHFAVQANLMSNPTVWGAMSSAYRQAEAEGLDLAARLLASLEAAEAAGGDIRGRQSAALIVVSGKPTGKAWVDRTYDLRIEDSKAPLPELRRLLTLARAYNHMNRGDELAADKKWDEAMAEYAAAARLAPEESELPFWEAVTLTSAGKDALALPIFRRVFEMRPEWADLVPRLPAAGLLPDDPARIAAIVALRPASKIPADGKKKVSR